MRLMLELDNKLHLPTTCIYVHLPALHVHTCTTCTYYMYICERLPLEFDNKHHVLCIYLLHAYMYIHKFTYTTCTYYMYIPHVHTTCERLLLQFDNKLCIYLLHVCTCIYLIACVISIDTNCKQEMKTM